MAGKDYYRVKGIALVSKSATEKEKADFTQKELDATRTAGIILSFVEHRRNLVRTGDYEDAYIARCDVGMLWETAQQFAIYYSDGSTLGIRAFMEACGFPNGKVE